MAGLLMYASDVSDKGSEDESDFDDKFDDAMASMMEEAEVKGLISLLLNNLNDKGKRVFIGKLREALRIGKVQGGICTKNVDELNEMIKDHVGKLGYDTAYSIALDFYTSGDLKPNYMMGDGITIFPEFFGIKMPDELTGLSSGDQTGCQTPTKRRRIDGSPYGGRIPNANQLLTPGRMEGSPDFRDPFSDRPDWNPDRVAEEFPDNMDEDTGGPRNKLCPSCVTGLCDTHIQLRF